MRKHIIGFAIFTLIIGSVVLFHTLNYFSGEITVEKPYMPDSCWKMKAKVPKITYSEKDEKDVLISYKLQDWSFDTSTNVLTAKVQLDWKGIGKQPAAVVVQLNFISLEIPSKEILVASESIENPFETSDTLTKTFTTVVTEKNQINSRTNYYGTINIWSLDEFNKDDSNGMTGTMTLISLNDQEKLAHAAPVLMIHEK